VSITARHLYEAGLNTDGVNGFLAQLSYRRMNEVIWPDHLTGKRVDDFREGSNLARYWMAMRRGYANARRSARAKDFKEIGATSTLLPASVDRQAEQLHCLNEVMKLRAKPSDPAQTAGAKK
jgi:hypothetical protein